MIAEVTIISPKRKKWKIKTASDREEGLFIRALAVVAIHHGVKIDFPGDMSAARLYNKAIQEGWTFKLT